MPEFVEELLPLLMSFAVLAVVGGVAAGVLWFLFSPRPRRLFPVQRLRPIHWRGSEVILAFFTWQLANILALSLFDAASFYQRLYDNEPSLIHKSLWSSLLAAPLSFALIYFVMFSISQTRPHDMGMTLTRWPQNAVAGYVVWLITTPFIWTVFILLQTVVTPEKHAIAELTGVELSTLEWALVAFQVVFYAPLAEELLFRGLLLGWLRRTTLIGHGVIAGMVLLSAAYALTPLFTDNTNSAVKSPPKAPAAKAKATKSPPAATTKSAPSRPPGVRNTPAAEATTAEPKEIEGVNLPLVVVVVVLVTIYVVWAVRVLAGPQQPSERATALLAVFGSSLLFAFYHSAWPSQIALTLFGLTAGWLSYRTQSLVGPIVLHGLFNAISFVMLYVSVAS